MDTAGRCRVAGLALGIGVAYACTRTYLFDLAPVALALLLFAGVALGEAAASRTAPRQGSASLRPRRVRDYLPAMRVVPSLVMAATVLVLPLALPGPGPDRPSAEIKYFGVADRPTLDSTLATLAVSSAIVALVIWLAVRSPRLDEGRRHTTVRTLADAGAALIATCFTAVLFWYADDQLDWRGGGSVARGVGLSIAAGVGVLALAGYASSLATTPQPVADHEDVPVAV